MGINISHKLVLISHVKPVVIWVLGRIKIMIVILNEFVDLIEVVRIKMVTLYAKVPFDRFSKELRFVGVGLGDFVSVLQSRIIALTLRLKKVFLISRQDSLESVSKLMELQNFSQLACDSTLRSSLTCFCN